MTGRQVIEVANYDRWPGYRRGQLYSFHCISERYLLKPKFQRYCLFNSL
jgi:hypothetical protein